MRKRALAVLALVTTAVLGTGTAAGAGTEATFLPVTPSTVTAPVRTATVPATTRTVDVRYGTLPQQTATLTYDPTKRNQPWVVLIHGGAWRWGSKANMTAYVGPLTWQGFAVLNIDYRLANVAQWPAPMVDTVTAVKWLKAHAATYRVDPRRGALLGGSAGGHIAVTTALTYPGLVRGVVSISGVLQPQRTFTSQYLTMTNVLQEFGCSYTLAATPCGRRWRSALPELHVDAADPPIYVVHGSADDVVPVASAVQVARLLPRRTLVIVKDAGHFGVLPPDGGTRWLAAARFLRTATA